MMSHRRPFRTGSIAIVAAGCVLAIALSGSPRDGANAPRPAHNAPTPYPLPSFGPASQPTTLPYPAYGTPAPGVQSTRNVVGVAHVISLKDATDVALARSPTLVQALASVHVQDAAVGLAKTAIFPSLSGSASSTYQRLGGAFRSSGGTVSSSGAPSRNGSTVSNAAGLNLAQLIFDGGRVVAQLHQARATDVATLDTYKRSAQTIAYAAAQAYYSSLQAQRGTQVALETVKLDQVQVDLVQAQLRAGTASNVDVATAELPLAQARLTLVQAQGTEQSAQATFANALGLPADANVLPLDDTPVFDPSTFASLQIPTYDLALDRAVALRPDFDASKEQIDAARAALRAARLGNFPTLNGVASYGVNSTDPNGGSYGNTGSVGLQLAVPIYDQGITAAQTKTAQANLDSARAGLTGEQRTVELSVKQALVGLVSARAQLDQARAQYDEASKVLEATEAQYRAGVTTLPLLLNAQVAFTSALTARVTAVYNLRQAQQTYLYQTGANLTL